jgi:hypothetical protein
MKSNRYLTKAITSILQRVGKNNKSIYALAVFGVSNALHGSFGKNLSNYETRDFFKSSFSNDFAMTEEEVGNIIDKLFDVKEEQMKKIKSNINARYNGYYCKSGPKLYQIYSTTRYLEDCYQEYKKKGITLNEKNDKWIPPPSPYSVSSKSDGLFNYYLSKGFSGYLYHSLLNLYQLKSSILLRDSGDVHRFLDYQSLFLTDTLTSVMIQNGYLKIDYKDKNFNYHAKISNCEVLYLFDQKLKEYLNSIPIETKYISNLSKAVIAEDFEIFGVELTKSLNKKLNLNEEDDNLEKTKKIHSLMLKLFSNLNSNSENEGDTKIYAKLGQTRSRMQFHFGSAEKVGKTYYIIELDDWYYGEDDINEDSVLGRLASIFNFNYHQNILETGEDATIVMMGMAAPHNKVYLATLKVSIANGKIIQTTAIKHQRFWIERGCEHDPQVKLTEQREYHINMIDIKTKARLNAIGKENTEEYNEMINKGFEIEINSIRKEVKKSGLNVKSSTVKQDKCPKTKNNRN